MKLTGPAWTEALSGAEKARTRERTEGNAGGVRVERRVRHAPTLEPPELPRALDSGQMNGMPIVRSQAFNEPNPKAKIKLDCASGGARWG